MSVSNVKILVSYHVPSVLVKTDVFTPIHCGRILKSPTKDGQMNMDEYHWMHDNMIGDDTGENISDQNRSYCEMTGIYWAWKNYEQLGNPDYIGFMHYRRIFIFPDDEQGEPRIYKQRLSDSDYQRYLDLKNVNWSEYDIYAPKWLPVYKFKLSEGRYVWTKKPPEVCKIREQHPDNIGEKEMLYYLRQYYPTIIKDAEEYYEGKKCFQWNMFIFKKEIFFEYCQYIFKILKAVDKEIDKSYFSTADTRYLGYLAEILTGIFIFHKIRTNFKVKHLSVIHIHNTSLHKHLYPSFKEDCISVCCSADNSNILRNGVMIKSLIEHADPHRNYEITILEKGLADKHRDKIRLLSKGCPNINIRFYDISKHIADVQCSSNSIITTSCYKFFIPHIFCEYKRVVYLDEYAIVEDDIANLFGIDLCEKWVAACWDYTIASGLNSKRERLEYYRNVLGITNPYTECFSVGVMVFNIAAIKESNIEDILLNAIINNEFGDQDSFNKICYQHVHFLNTQWNVCPQWKDSAYLPDLYYWQWKMDCSSPKILHYRGTVSRPWNNAALDYAYHWWKYARMTPFYEEIDRANFRVNAEEIIKKILAKGGAVSDGKMDKPLVQDIYNYWEYISKLKRLRWKILFSFGKKRKELLSQKKELKSIIKNIKRKTRKN